MDISINEAVRESATLDGNYITEFDSITTNNKTTTRNDIIFGTEDDTSPDHNSRIRLGIQMHILANRRIAKQKEAKQNKEKQIETKK